MQELQMFRTKMNAGDIVDTFVGDDCRVAIVNGARCLAAFGGVLDCRAAAVIEQRYGRRMLMVMDDDGWAIVGTCMPGAHRLGARIDSPGFVCGVCELSRRLAGRRDVPADCQNECTAPQASGDGAGWRYRCAFCGSTTASAIVCPEGSSLAHIRCEKCGSMTVANRLGSAADSSAPES